jgi:hypothetical protein
MGYEHGTTCIQVLACYTIDKTIPILQYDFPTPNNFYNMFIGQGVHTVGKVAL